MAMAMAMAWFLTVRWSRLAFCSPRAKHNFIFDVGFDPWVEIEGQKWCTLAGGRSLPAHSQLIPGGVSRPMRAALRACRNKSCCAGAQ
jgi:hypothetical protein